MQNHDAGVSTCCGILSRKGSIATAATTVTVTTTVEMQPSRDSHDSFLKDGMNIRGNVATVPTTTENANGLKPAMSATQRHTLSQRNLQNLLDSSLLRSQCGSIRVEVRANDSSNTAIMLPLTCCSSIVCNCLTVYMLAHQPSCHCNLHHCKGDSDGKQQCPNCSY